MKKIIYLLLITTAIVSCKKDKEDKSILEISKSSIAKSEFAFQETLQITTNGKWYVNTDASWISFDKTEGTGNASLVVSASQNIEVNKRTATLRFIMNNETKVVTVSQEGRERLKLSNNNIKSGISASTLTINVTSSTDWIVVMPNTINWFSVSPTSGTGNGTITVNINQNMDAAGRNGTFTVKTAFDNLLVNVNQDGVNPDAALAGWNLIFFDEFKTNGSFDSSKWSFCPRSSTSVAWIKYLTENENYASVSDGNLVLRMDNASIPGDNVPYHSGGVQTLGKFSFKYGKVEVRAKFKQGQGAWPAIWMMPVTATYGGWPNSGEIDIMEHVNYENVAHQTVHNGAVTNSGGSSSATSSSSFTVNDYNIYGLEWTESALKFFVNGNLRYTYNKPANPTSANWPFDQPFYLILNQSGGAGWPGAINNSDLPFDMKVDWVRVYQRS